MHAAVGWGLSPTFKILCELQKKRIKVRNPARKLAAEACCIAAAAAVPGHIKTHSVAKKLITRRMREVK